MSENDLSIAIDIGGTFTDLVSWSRRSGRLSYAKSLTTYDSLSNGVFDCLRFAGVNLSEAAWFLHGSTIAINTVIQRKGSRTGLITTRGFRDIYTIARGDRQEAYNLLFSKAEPLAPRDLTMEVDERMNARGEVTRPLDLESARIAVRALVEKGVEAIAVVLLHAYRNPAHEQAVKAVLEVEAPGVYVSLSHEILREFREYERTSTTVLNAYVGPIVANYVRELENRLKTSGFAGNFLVMQSNGGVMSASVAREKPVTMMESGPVAGVIGAGRLGVALGIPDVISFDMGGTTAKASLIEKGEARVVSGYHIGGQGQGHPMMLPVVDIVEVGAGGGSIAWIDAAGGLKVGPLSAGSAPGPVCYGAGGVEPTITDANLVLGRLDPDHFLGGQMKLDLPAARGAIEVRIARPLGLSIEEAALGIVKIADTKMSLAVREVSVAKGHDPRGFALVASGGAGPLHALSIARELSLPRVIVPELPGAFSAFGMLMTDVRHDYVRTLICDLASSDPALLASCFDDMAAEAAATLKRDGVNRDNAILSRALDLRYLGQEYTLTVPLVGAVSLDSLAKARQSFDDKHLAQYSHAAYQEPVEVVNLRLVAVGEIEGRVKSFASVRDLRHIATGNPKGARSVIFEQGAMQCPVFDRDNLVVGATVMGPAIIEERVSTTVIHPGDCLTLLPMGPLLIEVAE